MAIQFSIIKINAPDGRDEHARDWNALWAASTSRLPLSRYELIELWHETFASGQRLHGLVIEREGRWVAALPLVSKRFGGMLPIWDVPYDDWTGSLELIVAEDVVDDPAVYDSVISALRTLRCPLLRVAQMASETAANRGLMQAVKRTRLAFDVAARHSVGVIDVCGPNAPPSWEAYQAAWSGNFRRQMRKMMRRAEELGGVELVVHQPDSSHDVEPLVREGFAIEDQSWKGRSGTSVIRTPGMLEYFVRQARLLADKDELTLLFLKHGGQSIAFEYGWSCRRIYYSPKVGFDDRFSHLSPGQVLRLLWLEKLFDERTHDAIDFAGPLSEATEKWSTRSYPLQRLIAATGPTGRVLIGAGRAAVHLRNQARWLAARAQQTASGLRRPQPVPSPSPTASKATSQS